MAKRILVGLGTSVTAESVTRHAIDIAKPHAAELVGLAISDPLRLDWPASDGRGSNRRLS